MKQYADDRSFEEYLRRAFLQQFHAHIKRMCDAINHNQKQRINESIHLLIGSSSILGYYTIVQELRKMEQTLQEIKLEKLKLYDHISALISFAIEETNTTR